jgi:hypothetical protein
MRAANTQKLRAKGQELLFPHSRHLSNGDVLRRNASLSDTLQSTRGRGSWDPNGGSQSTGMQAFPGFPADAALGLAMNLSNPAALWTQRWPADLQVLHTKYRRKASRESTKIYL